jgi:pre-mRNA-splicing helicase BRR2
MNKVPVHYSQISHLQLYFDWLERIGAPLKKTIVLLTGENSVDIKLLKRADVVISTAERWDNISRRWKNRSDVQKVKLFMVDNLHMVTATNGVIPLWVSGIN